MKILSTRVYVTREHMDRVVVVTHAVTYCAVRVNIAVSRTSGPREKPDRSLLDLVYILITLYYYDYYYNYYCVRSRQ